MTDMIAIATITSARVYEGRRALEFRLAGMKIFIAFSIGFFSVDWGSALGLPSKNWQDSVAK